jgi:hypothetical protein
MVVLVFNRVYFWRRYVLLKTLGTKTDISFFAVIYEPLTKLRRKASAKKARNGPSTDVIEYASFVKIAIDIKKVKSIAIFLAI